MKKQSKKKKGVRKELDTTDGKTKKVPRKEVKYPALNPAYNLKSRSHLIDFDYLDRLTPQELQFLNDFMEGYANADFRTPSVGKMFKDVKARRKIYRENNARNRCFYTRAAAKDALLSYEDAVQFLDEEVFDEEFKDYQIPDPQDSGTES
jgi:hypothetical protein